MMSSAVEMIIKKTQFAETVDGVEFVLRRISGKLAVEVLGNKTLGLVRAGKVREGTDLNDGDLLALMERYLTAAMVSPKVAPESNAEADEISFSDLGEWAPKVLEVVFRESGFGELGNSQPPSQDTEGEN